VARTAPSSSTGHEASTVSAVYSITSSSAKRAAPRVYQTHPSVPSSVSASPGSVETSGAEPWNSTPETITTPASASTAVSTEERAGRTPSSAQRSSCVVIGMVAITTAPCDGTECARPVSSSTLKTPKPATPRPASADACARSLRHGAAPRGSSSARKTRPDSV